jgi:hypothetical protein
MCFPRPDIAAVRQARCPEHIFLATPHAPGYVGAMSSFAVLLGQLLAIAFACGLNLYATVALLGLASRLGWMSGLPPGLRGLENGFVIGSAALLYLFEFVIDKVPYVDS